MTLTTQFLTMITMIGMGSLFGASLDTYNRFLQRQKRKSWIVFINDLLFWVLQGMSIFYVLFLVNEGDVRIYIFLALLCGFAAYQSLLKRIYLNCLEWIISVVISTYRLAVKIVHNVVYRPLRYLFLSTISLILLTGKGLLMLLKWIFSIVRWILKVILKPVQLLCLFFWKLMPKRIKKNVEKLYNKMAGIIRQFKKYTVTIIKKIKKIKK
jgi:spore cortex biosynthesis protein YabQ